MRFERLSLAHLQELFRFETDNRAWFEEWIAPRGEDFYSLSAVQEHISKNLADFEKRIYVPFVLMEGSEIIARANMKEVCVTSRSAEVGYRVAKKHVGKGVASACLKRMVEEAETELRLTRLRANVLDNNPASRRVLEKQGFTPTSYEPEFWEINGTMLGCTIMERNLL